MNQNHATKIGTGLTSLAIIFTLEFTRYILNNTLIEMAQENFLGMDKTLLKLHHQLNQIFFIKTIYNTPLLLHIYATLITISLISFINLFEGPRRRIYRKIHKYNENVEQLQFQAQMNELDKEGRSSSYFIFATILLSITYFSLLRYFPPIDKISIWNINIYAYLFVGFAFAGLSFLITLHHENLWIYNNQPLEIITYYNTYIIFEPKNIIKYVQKYTLQKKILQEEKKLSKINNQFKEISEKEIDPLDLKALNEKNITLSELNNERQKQQVNIQKLKAQIPQIKPIIKIAYIPEKEALKHTISIKTSIIFLFFAGIFFGLSFLSLFFPKKFDFGYSPTPVFFTISYLFFCYSQAKNTYLRKQKINTSHISDRITQEIE